MTRRLSRDQSYDARMLDVGHMLMTEFEDTPLIEVVQALNRARRAIAEPDGRVDPVVAYQLARSALATSPWPEGLPH